MHITSENVGLGPNSRPHIKPNTKIMARKMEVTNMKIYCFKAECEIYVDELCMILGDKIKKIQKVIEYPSRSVEVEIEIDMNLKQLLDEMKIVPDGHVMLQTVALKNGYAGAKDDSRHDETALKRGVRLIKRMCGRVNDLASH